MQKDISSHLTNMIITERLNFKKESLMSYSIPKNNNKETNSTPQLMHHVF